MVWFDECSILKNDQKSNGLLNEEQKSKQSLQNTIRSILICWLDTYPEDFYSTTFVLLNRLIDFARSRNIYDLKHKARKCREKFRRIMEEGGLSCKLIIYN